MDNVLQIIHFSFVFFLTFKGRIKSLNRQYHEFYEGIYTFISKGPEGNQLLQIPEGNKLYIPN